MKNKYYITGQIKKRLKIFLSFSICIGIFSTAEAQDTIQIDDSNSNVTTSLLANGGISISYNGTCQDTDTFHLVFPDSLIHGGTKYPIVEIALDGFRRKCIQSIENLPTHLKVIGEAAFQYNQLTTLSLESLPVLSSIGEDAFSNNPIATLVLDSLPRLKTLNPVFGNNIESLTLTRLDSLDTIANAAFLDNQLTELTLENLPALSFIGFGAFSNNQLTTLSLESLPVLSSIGEDVFLNNPIATLVLDSLPRLKTLNPVFGNNIESLTLTRLDSLDTIPPNAFSGSPLTSLTLDDLPSLDSIYSQVFWGSNDSKLTSPLDLSSLSALQYIGARTAITDTLLLPARDETTGSRGTAYGWQHNDTSYQSGDQVPYHAARFYDHPIHRDQRILDTATAVRRLLTALTGDTLLYFEAAYVFSPDTLIDTLVYNAPDTLRVQHQYFSIENGNHGSADILTITDSLTTWIDTLVLKRNQQMVVSDTVTAADWAYVYPLAFAYRKSCPPDSVQPLFSIDTALHFGDTLLIINRPTIDLDTDILYDTAFTPFGCKEITAYHITVKPLCYDTIAINICPGDNLVYDDQVFTSPMRYNNYLIKTDSMVACDTLRTLVLEYYRVYEPMDTMVIQRCQSEVYVKNTGKEVRYTGQEEIYDIDTFQTVNGCDSLIAFKISYVNTFTARSGTFDDGSGGNIDYPNSFNCAWRILTDTGKLIRLNFTVFDTELNKDWVHVYDGTDATGTLLGSFSGNTFPPVVVSTSSTLYIQFITDDDFYSEGWKVDYESFAYQPSTAIQLSNATVIATQPAGTQVGTLTTEKLLDTSSYSYTYILEDVSETFRIEGDRLLTTKPLTPGNYSIKISSDDNVFPIPIQSEFTIKVLPAPMLQVGDQVEQYVILGVPTDSVTVQQLFPTFSPDSMGTQWRVVHYQNKDYVNLDAESTLFAGKGYWMLSRKEATMNLAELPLPTLNENQEFELSLQVGYNLISNPFLDPLDWQQVLAYNQMNAGLNLEDIESSIFIYDKGYQMESTLNILQGGWVNANKPLTLLIPFLNFSKKEASSRNSANSQLAGSWYLAPDQWQLILFLQNDVFTTNVPGIGMRPEARLAKDRYDLGNPPASGELLFALEDAHGLARNFLPDAVPAVWDFQIRTERPAPVTIIWDRNIIEQLPYNLYIEVHPQNKKMNMLATRSLEMRPDATFTIYYGEPNETFQQDIYLTAYPNPVEEQVVFDFFVPNAGKDYTVSIDLYTIHGQQVWTRQATAQGKRGEVVVHNLHTQLGHISGIFLYRVKYQNQISPFKKLMVR